MASAEGIAGIIAGTSAATRRFIAIGTDGTIVGNFSENDDKSGTWSRSGATITWGGANPTMQNTTGTTASVTGLKILTSPVGIVIANIPHPDVTLADNYSIVYTSIEITFTTDDLT